MNQNGDVTFKLKSPYRDGTTHLVMTGLEFMQKLRPGMDEVGRLRRPSRGAKVERRWRPPWMAEVKKTQERFSVAAATAESHSLSRCAGTFMPFGYNAKWRSQIVPQDMADPLSDDAGAEQPISGQSCARAFSASLHVIAAIEDPSTIAKILKHLGLPARAPPRAPAKTRAFYEFT